MWRRPTRKGWNRPNLPDKHEKIDNQRPQKNLHDVQSICIPLYMLLGGERKKLPPYTLGGCKKHLWVVHSVYEQSNQIHLKDEGWWLEP